MPDYIDASALLAVVLKEPANGLVDALMRDRTDAVLVSDLCMVECSSAIATLGRRTNIDPTQVNALWRELDQWVATFAQRVSTESGEIGTSISIVRQFEHKLRAADAIHVAAAARRQARLVTLDRQMTKAASALGVAVINPAKDGYRND